MADKHDLVHYPRAYVAIDATVGEARQVQTAIVPNKATVSRRSHSQAGTAEVEVHGSALPYDPRLIEGIFLQVYIASASRVNENINTVPNLRFVGFVDEIETKRDDQTSVTLKARDMSAILRDFKPLPPEAVPRYSDTLGEAIVRILDAVPGTREPNGEPRLAIGDDVASQQFEATSLSAAAPPRKPDAPVQLARDATAWAAIEHICGLCTVLPSVQLKSIRLRSPTDVYGHTRPARAEYIFGGNDANLLSVETRKKFVRNRKGVTVRAYAPREPGGYIEGSYPDDADLLASRRPASNSRRGSTTPPERDIFPGVGLHTSAACRHYAERIYRERSRQEIEGTLKTPVWDAATLALDNGDRTTLTIAPDLSAELRNTRSRAAALDLLQRRLGIERDAAEVLLDASDRPTDLWYVRDVTHEFEHEGLCSTSIEYINLIELPE